VNADCGACGRDLKGHNIKVEMSRSGGRAEVKPGDWTCDQCRVNNFARRDACFRCGAPRPRDYDQYGGGRDGGGRDGGGRGGGGGYDRGGYDRGGGYDRYDRGPFHGF
jgi:hypothetical protein